MRRENHWYDTGYAFDGTGAKKQQKSKPPVKKENEEYVLFEEDPKEAEKTASSGTFVKSLHQSRSDNMARAMGVGKDVFDSIERDHEESIRQKREAEEKRWQDFGRTFGEILAKENGQTTRVQANRFGSGIENKTKKETEANEKRYLSPMQRASIERSNNIYERYKAGEEWLMSEGEDDLIKGIINNFRSSVGGLAEDVAYLINDYVPWYKPAKKVVENNTAGKIKEAASKQFKNAKEKVGETGKRAIDMADSFSESLGYSIFGLKASSYLEAAGESLREYRKLRESGYSEEEAVGMATEKAIIAALMEKAGDYIGKNNPVDEVLYGRNGKNKRHKKRPLQNSAGYYILEVMMLMFTVNQTVLHRL